MSGRKTVAIFAGMLLVDSVFRPAVLNAGVVDVEMADTCCCHCMVRHFCPFPGRTDCARHLGGCLLARAPDLQNYREWDCLYEVCHFLFLFE